MTAGRTQLSTWLKQRSKPSNRWTIRKLPPSLGNCIDENGIIDWDDSEADVRIEVLLLPFFSWRETGCFIVPTDGAKAD